MTGDDYKPFEQKGLRGFELGLYPAFRLEHGHKCRMSATEHSVTKDNRWNPYLPKTPAH